MADPDLEVHVAVDGCAASMAGLTQAVGLMILDRNMSGIRSDRAIRALRAGRSPNSDVPMVLASADADRARYGRRDAGEPNFYVTKPLDMKIFVPVIRTLTGRGRARAAAMGS